MTTTEYERNVILSSVDYNVVGTRPIRHDGADKVTGRALYGADFDTAGTAARQGAAKPACPRQHREHRHQRG